MKDLIGSQEDIIDFVHQVRFRNVISNFQRKLNEDLQTTKLSNKSLRQQKKPQTCIN